MIGEHASSYKEYRGLEGVEATNMYKKVNDRIHYIHKGKRIIEEINDKDEIFCEIHSSEIWINTEIILSENSKSFSIKFRLKAVKEELLNLLWIKLIKIGTIIWNVATITKPNFYFIQKMEIPDLKLIQKEHIHERTNSYKNSTSQNLLDIEMRQKISLNELFINDVLETEDNLSVKLNFSTLESSIISLLEISEKNVTIFQETKNPYILMNEKKENTNLLRLYKSAPIWI